MNYRYACIGLGLGAALWLTLACTKQESGGDIELHKKLAGELQENHLYYPAIEEYHQILSAPGVDQSRQANINFLIGKIYFENIKDYEQAAAYFVRARALDPNGSFVGEASQNLVACLEKTGRVLDAKRELGTATAVDSTPRPAGDVAVAKIDGQPIWRSQLEEQIQQLPPSIQKQLLSHEARLNYLRNYVGVELLYRAAQREHFEADPALQRQKEQLFKKLVVQKYVEQKVMPSVSIDTADVRNFYLANKDTRYKGMPYDSAKAQVFMDYEGQKTESAYGEYIGRLAASSKVEILEQNLR
jgi:tetratricopeptide (TPR) repeat protein